MYSFPSSTGRIYDCVPSEEHFEHQSTKDINVYRGFPVRYMYFIWLVIKQLRNRFTSLVKKAKSDFCVDNTTSNLNDPKKFWKIVKSSFGDDTRDELPACIVNDAHTTLTEKPAILNYFNEHFFSSGSLFESLHPHQPNVQGVCPHSPIDATAPGFDLTPFEAAEVHRALQQLDLINLLDLIILSPSF